MSKILKYLIYGVIALVTFPLWSSVLIPCAVVYVVYLLIKSSNRGGDRNHVSGENYLRIDDLKMDTEDAQVVFNYYKNALDNGKTFANLFEIEEDKREYERIQNIYDSLEDGQDKSLIDGLVLTLMASCSTDERGFQLKSNEQALFYTPICAIDTTTTIGSNVSYVGVRPSTSPLRINFGTVYANKIEKVTRYDAGELLLTDKRILFKGTSKNKVINLGSIMSIEKYDDNGLILHLTTQKYPVIILFIADRNFYHNKKEDVYVYHNDLIEFVSKFNSI